MVPGSLIATYRLGSQSRQYHVTFMWLWTRRWSPLHLSFILRKLKMPFTLPHWIVFKTKWSPIMNVNNVQHVEFLGLCTVHFPVVFAVGRVQEDLSVSGNGEVPGPIYVSKWRAVRWVRTLRRSRPRICLWDPVSSTSSGGRDWREGQGLGPLRAETSSKWQIPLQNCEFLRLRPIVSMLGTPVGRRPSMCSGTYIHHLSHTLLRNTDQSGTPKMQGKNFPSTILEPSPDFLSPH